MEGFKSLETRETEPPKNKFLELWKYFGRKSESAQASKHERNIQLAESYDGALGAVHASLEKAYLESIGEDSSMLGDTDKEALGEYINSLSVEQIEHHIDLMKARWEGFAQAKEEDDKKDELAEIYRSIDGLEEVRTRLIS
ncbi:hypothetical protein KGM48_02985 [Patescibacteria group bacterium]|nr:hypothetical protein [Patescibacteria group bacterium]